MIERLRHDIVGGIVSSLMAIPLALGFGMFVFVTLGGEYFAHGAVAGLISAFVAGVVCILLGDRSTIVYAPRITTTFFLGLLLLSLVRSSEPDLQSASVTFRLIVLFAIVVLAGLFQALFGALRLGTLIKFVPHPVMAGFQNMAAALLFLVQLGNVLGYDRNVPFMQALGEIANARPLSVAVAAVTFAATWYARFLTTRVPPLLVGLCIGVATYYALVLAGFSPMLGQTIGLPSPSVTMPWPYADLADAATLRRLVGLWETILPGALALATVAAIDAVLCAKLASRPGDPRRNSDRMLVRLGLSNAVSGAVGGITAGINIGPSVVNRNFGGRSWVSVAVNAAVLLAAILFLLPLVTQLPRTVLSALIMVVAIQHIDPWSKDATRRVFARGAARKGTPVLDLGVALVVSILSITVHIVLAVFLGLALAASLFVFRMGRSVVRRQYRCATVRSRRARAPEDMATLERSGASILVIELQGALFFGSADRLAQDIETSATPDTRWLILDLRRVTEIDSTGLRILLDIEGELARRAVTLGLVVPDRSSVRRALGEQSAPQFVDVDRAIEWAEDQLLEDGRAGAVPVAPAAELPLEQFSLLRQFTPAQIVRLRPYLQLEVWPAGSTIFNDGDPGSHLFLVAQGRASVRLLSADRNIRLATFGPGSLFGELALLDKGPRSATITADEDVVTWALAEQDFRELQFEEPEIAVNILSALGRELSGRLRQANMTIHQLEA
jgi:MFS superfamily sulfate permease-like transporter